MALNATITGRTSTQTIVVDSTGGRITPVSGGSGVTLKNQQNEIRSIADIGDVVESNLVNGATFQYNTTSEQYEVKPFAITDSNLDGGTF